MMIGCWLLFENLLPAELTATTFPSASFWPDNHREQNCFFVCSTSKKWEKKLKTIWTLKWFVSFTQVIHNLLLFFFLQNDNVEACLAVLRQNSVPGVESVTTNDIINGRLKAILSLFFSLSRYKQASKLKAPSNKLQQAHTSTLDMMHATRWAQEMISYSFFVVG